MTLFFRIHDDDDDEAKICCFRSTSGCLFLSLPSPAPLSSVCHPERRVTNKKRIMLDVRHA